jgi:hypothetical protein
VVGTSSLTSLGLTISGNIVAISGNNLLGTLIMSMIACLILGMGLPTTANYIVCSTIIVPALTMMNVERIAAPLFVFYFGIMADLTPPVCLAAFTGAGIAGASPARTGFTATRITIASYLLPYVFVYDPMLVLVNVEPGTLFMLILSALLGVMAMAGALEGWLKRDLKWWERIPMGFIAIAAIHHNMTLSLVGSVVIVVAYVFFQKTAKQGQAIACSGRGPSVVQSGPHRRYQLHKAAIGTAYISCPRGRVVSPVYRTIPMNGRSGARFLLNQVKCRTSFRDTTDPDFTSMPRSSPASFSTIKSISLFSRSR